MLSRRSNSNSITSLLLVAGMAALAVVALTFACGGDADCDSDSDCAGDRVCELGDCIDPPNSDDGNGDSNGTDNDSNGSDNNSTDQNTTEEHWCCINGAFYECNTEEDAQQCFDETDPSPCTRDSSRDGDCDTTGTEGDLGDICSSHEECEHDVCVDSYCSKPCSDSFDCPDFWTCEEIFNPPEAGQTYCVEG